MKLQFYILVDRHGVVQARKQRPKPDLNQVAIHLSVDIDDKWFVRPVPRVELTIPDDHIQPMAVVQSEPIEQENGGL